MNTQKKRIPRHPFWPHAKKYPLFTLLLVTLMLGLILLTGAKGTLALLEVIDFGNPADQQITVEGEGKVVVAPDTARLNLGVLTKGVNVAEAQNQNTATTNSLIGKLKDLGIESEDIRTSDYSVYEDRIWNRENNQYDVKGWIVSQNLTLTIRDLENVSQVISVAGMSGITNISGINFSTDNVADLKTEARDEAIASAKKQAEAIAKALGVKVKGVVSYNERSSDGGGPVYTRALSVAEDAVVAPQIEPGTDDLRITVSVTYQLSN